MFPEHIPTLLDSKIITSESLTFKKKLDDKKIVLLGSDPKANIRQAVFLGKICEANQSLSYNGYNVFVDTGFPSVIMIYGVRGTGKSYTLGDITEGLISDEGEVSHGSSDNALVLFDTLGHFWQMTHPPPDSEEEHHSILRNWGLTAGGFDNLRVFVPKGYPRADPSWEELALAYSDMEIDDWCGVLDTNRYDKPLGQLLSDAYRKVVETGWNEIDFDADGNQIAVGRVDANPNYSIDNLIHCIQKDEGIRSDTNGFDISTIRALTSRLSAIRDANIFDVNGTPIEEIFVRGSLSVIKMNKISDDLKALIAGLITKKIFRYREEGKEQEELSRIRGEDINPETIFPKGWILIDEAHNYCPTTGSNASKDWIIKYAKEGRSLGLGMIGTTQQPAALDGRLTSQVNILVCHSLSFARDIQSAADRMLNLGLKQVRIENESYETSVLENVLRSLENGEALISSRDSNRVFVCRIRPRIAAHGGGHPQNVDQEDA